MQQTLVKGETLLKSPDASLKSILDILAINFGKANDMNYNIVHTYSIENILTGALIIRGEAVVVLIDNTSPMSNTPKHELETITPDLVTLAEIIRTSYFQCNI